MNTSEEAAIDTDGVESFEAFVAGFDRSLFQALVPLAGVHGAQDAAADALAYAWQHWDRVGVMANRRGYVYAAARNAARRAASRRLEPPGCSPSGPEAPEYQPELVGALRQLTESQRCVVYLVDGCGWGLTETADLLGVSISTVRNHRARGINRLRSLLEGDDDA